MGRAIQSLYGLTPTVGQTYPVHRSNGKGSIAAGLAASALCTSIKKLYFHSVISKLNSTSVFLLIIS
jgi:hypothetical protein